MSLIRWQQQLKVPLVSAYLYCPWYIQMYSLRTQASKIVIFSYGGMDVGGKGAERGTRRERMNLKKQDLDIFFWILKQGSLPGNRKYLLKYKPSPRLFNTRHQHRDHSRTKYFKVASISQLKSCLVFPFPHTKLKLWCRRQCQIGLLRAVIGERRVDTYGKEGEK